MVRLTLRRRVTVSTTPVSWPATATRSHGRFSSHVTAASVVWHRSTEVAPRAADRAARNERRIGNGQGDEQCAHDGWGALYQLLL